MNDNGDLFTLIRDMANDPEDCAALAALAVIVGAMLAAVVIFA